MEVCMPIVPTVLQKIIARKHQEVAERKRKVPVKELCARAEDQTASRGFVDAIEQKIAAGLPAVIAEIKKASPSQGVIRHAFDPIAIAESYVIAGAACLSVLTDIDFFQGADHYLTAARDAVNLPIIRKDFIIDEYSVYEARALGADCILLIVAVLEPQRLRLLNNLAHELGMDVLIEVHDRQELKQALAVPNRLVGINNRNLHNFITDIDTTFALIDDIKDRIIVSESGINTPEQVQALRSKHVNAFLIGEAFMRADDPGEKLRQLFFASRQKATVS
jgi:indole-3-glycerol phosphate synthase